MKPKEPSLADIVRICLKKIRQEKEISQEELADLSGLDRTYISGFERGVRNITLGSAEKIITGLKVSKIQLFERLLNEIENH